MKTTPLTQKETLPQKILTRKDEIAADFLMLVEIHIDELLRGVVSKRFSSSDFAARLFIHPRHLTNTIKLALNESPCDIMENRLVGEAQKMLRGSNLSIAEIGVKLGYTEATNFTKFYKGMTGHTPLRYRKKSRTGN